MPCDGAPAELVARQPEPASRIDLAPGVAANEHEERVVDPPAAHLLGADDPRERAVVGRVRVRPEAVPVDPGAPAPRDHQAAPAARLAPHLPEVVLPAAVLIHDRQMAVGPGGGLGALGDAHAHALDLAGAPALGAVDLELRVVAVRVVDRVLPVALACRSRRRGRSAGSPQPVTRRTIASERGSSRGRRGRRWLNGESSAYGRQQAPGQRPTPKLPSPSLTLDGRAACRGRGRPRPPRARPGARGRRTRPRARAARARQPLGTRTPEDAPPGAARMRSALTARRSPRRSR